MNSAPDQSACRDSSSNPASRAIRSSSAGQTYRCGLRPSRACRLSSKLDVVRDDVLAQDVVGVDEQVARLRHLHRGVAVGREPAQVRHPELDHEPPAGLEVPRGVDEARDLLVLGEQVGDGVEDQVHQPCTRPRPAPSPCRPSRPGSRPRPPSRAAGPPSAPTARCRSPARRARRGVRRPGRSRWPARAPGPPPASATSRSTVGTSTSGANMPSPGVSYRLRDLVVPDLVLPQVRHRSTLVSRRHDW